MSNDKNGFKRCKTRNLGLRYVFLILTYSFIVLKRYTDAESGYTEDGRDGRIGATEYAEGNGTQKRGRKVEHIT